MSPGVRLVLRQASVSVGFLSPTPNIQSTNKGETWNLADPVCTSQEGSLLRQCVPLVCGQPGNHTLRVFDGCMSVPHAFSREYSESCASRRLGDMTLP